MPSPREAGGPGGQVPAMVVLTPADKNENRTKDMFFI
jgi:hypothetical protein